MPQGPPAVQGHSDAPELGLPVRADGPWSSAFLHLVHTNPHLQAQALLWGRMAAVPYFISLRREEEATENTLEFPGFIFFGNHQGLVCR